MPLFRICPGDPLAAVIRSRYDAYLLPVPTRAVRPGRIYESVASIRPVGWLTDLFTDASGIDLQKLVGDPEPAAEIVATHSSQLKADVGLNVLVGALQGLGVNSPLDVTASVNHSRGISYSFNDVKYWSINRLQLQKVIMGREVDPRLSERVKLAAGDPFLFVDAILTSSSLRVSFTIDDAASARVKLTGLSSQLGEA